MVELESEPCFYRTPLNGLCMLINICLNLHVYTHICNHRGQFYVICSHISNCVCL